jgi:hypothetical protein
MRFSQGRVVTLLPITTPHLGMPAPDAVYSLGCEPVPTTISPATFFLPGQQLMPFKYDLQEEIQALNVVLVVRR